MNDMQLRMIDIIKILNGNLPKHEKIVQACKRLSGLDMTHATPISKRSIGEYLHEMNNVLSPYDTVLKTWEDYQLISDEHLNKILKNIKRLCKKLIFVD